MRKLKLFMVACALMGAGQAWAQWTDVTSTYITNPSFESNGNSAASSGNLTITGWTETQSSAGSFNDTQTRDASTASSSAFGSNITPADGTYYLFYRHGWNGDAGTTATFTNTSKTVLPAGVYCIEFMYQQSYSEDSNSKTNTRIKFAAKNSGSEVASVTTGNATKNASFTNDGWNKSYFIFNLEEAATIDFEFTLYSGGQKRSDFLLDGIRLLKADNPATPVDNNTANLYLYNEKEGQYLSAGQNWGTQAICDNYGQEVTATLNNGFYTLKTQQYDNKYLGSDFYLDNGTGAKLLFLETAESSGKYYITADGVNYLTSNGAGEALLKNVTTPTDASVWTIVSKADRKTALSSATIDNPGNATFLIGDANFSRNCLQTPWTMTASNKNLSGGEDGNGGIGNHCAESWHSTFTLSQTLSSMPVGVYGLVAQGFYRQDGSDNDHLPYFYIADQTGTFPVRTGSEDSMTKASASFTAGSYTIDPIYYRLDAAGNITLGAKLETNTSLWCVFDNFQLYYYGDVTVAQVRLKAYIDAYNAAMEEAEAFTEESMFASDWSTLQTAISNNTLDLDDPALTESDLTTATANLVAANTAATAAVAAKTTYDAAVTLIDGGTNVDLTSLIVNPGFESGNTNGWTNSGSITANAQSNSSFDNKQGSYYAERWHVAGTIDLNQTIAYLPAGVYKVEAYMYSDTEDATLYANSEEASVSTSQKYHAVVTIADKGSIKIGGSCTLTGSTWICMDDFKLTYLAASIAELPYELATGKMGTDKSAAQEDAEDTFIAEPTMAHYNALLDAISAAEASVANYTKLKAAIDKANDIMAANNFVTAAATTAFQDEIDDATEGWTDVTFTDAEATAEIAALGSAVSGHRGNATGKAGTFMVSAWDTHTDGETAGEWDGYYINTWSTEGDTDGSGFSVPFLEYWVSATNNLPAKKMTATLTDLPNGCYEIEMWARVQRRSDADFNADNSMITMNVNGGEKVSIMSNTNNNVGTGGNTMRLGRYTARGMVTDGTLTLSIDVKLGANVHWLSWRDVNYEKVADESITISDAGFATYVSDNALDYSGVTGLKAYKATVAGNTITFSPVTTVPAGEGVLLKAAGDTYSVPVTAGVAAWDAEDNAFIRGTGEAVETGSGPYNYILNKVNGVIGFYRANGQTVATNRAYLQTTTNAARLNISFDDDDQTTGIARVEETVANDAVYTLSGVRVEKPTKGLYIKNGKKVVIK